MIFVKTGIISTQLVYPSPYIYFFFDLTTFIQFRINFLGMHQLYNNGKNYALNILQSLNTLIIYMKLNKISFR